MKNYLQIFSLLFCSFLFFPSNVAAQNPSNDYFKVLIHEVTVDLPIEKVWWGWTTDEGVQSFLAADSEVVMKMGGHYNLALYEKGSQLLKENKILSFIPQKMFSFEFTMPDQFPSLRNEKTWVVVEFTPRSAQETDVKITHLGWGKGGEWEAAYEYFSQAWLLIATDMQTALPQLLNPPAEKKETVDTTPSNSETTSVAQDSKYSFDSTTLTPIEQPNTENNTPKASIPSDTKQSTQTTSQPKTTPTMQQFAYMLSLNDPELARNPDAWTKEQSDIVGVHFNYLKQLTNEGTVILAGRSPDPEKGFGIVILKAASRAEAQEIMYSDPAVKNKLMSAELHDFRVALMGK